MKKIVLFLTLTVYSFIYGNDHQIGKNTVPFQVGVTSTLEIFQGDEVRGLRVPIFFGEAEKVIGVDFNIFASETDEFIGFQGGIFWGASIFSKVNTRFRGFGLGLVNLHGGDSKGLLIGPVNLTHEFKGLEIGILNYSNKKSGFEVGVVNYSNETFFQLGVVNIAKQVNGVQIGLLNFARNGILPVTPFINFNLELW